MKTHLRALILLFAAVMSPATSYAQAVGTPEFDPLGEHLDLPKLIRIMVEYVEMPHEEFTKLIEPVRRGADDAEMRESAKKLVKEEKARMLETSVITTTAGQRAKVESILEKIYPTEYDPPQISDGEADSENGEDEGAAGRAAVTPPTPTAFDIRNVGTTVEVEPNVDVDGVTVNLNIAPEIVYHGGEDSFGEWHTPDAESEVTQPRFYTMKCQTNITVIAGKYHMMTALSPHDEKGNPDPTRKVAVFVRADILLVGK